MMQTQEPITRTALHENKEEAQRLFQAYARMREAYQGLYDAYQALGLKHTIATVDELHFQQPEDFVREQIYEGSAGLKALPIKRDSAKAMIELPAEFPAFLRLANGIDKTRSFCPGVDTDFFEVFGGKVTLSDTLNAHIADQTSVYATEEEEEAFAEASALLEQLTAFHQRYPNIKLIAHDAVSTSLFYPTVNGEIHLRALMLKQD